MAGFDKLKQMFGVVKEGYDSLQNQANQAKSQNTERVAKILPQYQEDPQAALQRAGELGDLAEQAGGSMMGSINAVKPVMSAAESIATKSGNNLADLANKSESLKKLMQKNVFRSPEEVSMLRSRAKTELMGDPNAMITGSQAEWGDLAAQNKLQKLKDLVTRKK